MLRTRTLRSSLRSVEVSDFLAAPSTRSNNRESAAHLLTLVHSMPRDSIPMAPKIGFDEDWPFCLDILGPGELEGSGRFIMSTLAKVDQIPGDNQSLSIRQIVEIGRICGPG